jgi:hypothetical protein
VGVKKKKMAVWAILPLFPPFSREAFAGPGHTSHSSGHTHREGGEGDDFRKQTRLDSLSLLFEQRTTRTNNNNTTRITTQLSSSSSTSTFFELDSGTDNQENMNREI